MSVPTSAATRPELRSPTVEEPTLTRGTGRRGCTRRQAAVLKGTGPSTGVWCRRSSAPTSAMGREASLSASVGPVATASSAGGATAAEEQL